MSLLWSLGEIYVCGDPDCRSEVLVLRSPQKYPHRPTLPRCVCGSVLEIGGSVSAKTEPVLTASADAPRRQPEDVPE